MDIKKIALTLGTLVKDNAPAILEGVSIASSVGGAVAGCVGQNKADKVIAEMSEEDQKDLKKVFKATWKYYLPMAGLETLSVGTGIMSHKKEAEKYKALLSAYALAGNKTDKIVEKAEEKLGIKPEEDSKKDTTAKDQNAASKMVFMEQVHWIYEPVSGFMFRAKPSDVFGGCIRAAEDFNDKECTTIGDIVRNIDDLEYENELSEAADMFGWFSNYDNAESMIPHFTEGMVRPDGTVCLKLEFAKKPTSKLDSTWREDI